MYSNNKWYVVDGNSIKESDHLGKNFILHGIKKIRGQFSSLGDIHLVEISRHDAEQWYQDEFDSLYRKLEHLNFE